MSDPNEEFDIEAVRARVEADPGCAEFPALAELERLAGRAESAREISEVGLELAPARLAGRVSLGLALIDLGEHASAVRAMRPILDPLLEPHRLREWEDASSAESEAEAPEALAANETEPWSPPLPLAPQPAASFMRPYGAAASEAEATLDVDLEQSEIDVAFEQAESRPDEMISANRMAEEALLRSDLLCGEESIPEVTGPGDALELERDGSGVFEVDHAPAFRTETMAGLLERQGDSDAAQAIRDELLGGDAPPATIDAAVTPEPAPAPASVDTGSAGARTRILTTLEGWLRNIQRGTA